MPHHAYDQCVADALLRIQSLLQDRLPMPAPPQPLAVQVWVAVEQTCTGWRPFGAWLQAGRPTEAQVREAYRLSFGCAMPTFGAQVFVLAVPLRWSNDC